MGIDDSSRATGSSRTPASRRTTGSRTTGPRSGGPRRAPAALAGLLATAAALGLSELAAGLLPGAPSLVIAVGDAVIDAVPGEVERQAIALLGRNDKPVLIAGVLVLSGVFGALLGLLAARRFVLGAAGIVGFALVGFAAAMTDDRSELLATALVVALGAAAGVGALRFLLGAAPRTAVTAAAAPVPAAGGGDRRSFLRTSFGVLVVAAVGGVAGQLLSARERIDDIRAAIRLPRPARPAPVPPPLADLEIPGLSPLYVPNRDFYRIDTALRVPQVDPASWSLEVTGMVDRPLRLSYAELMDMPQIEADVTLVCVSNEVGGGLVGNARWQGVPLRALLDRAGVQEGATQVLGRSVDGFTAGFPTLTALAAEEAMVAVGMNGEPLPADHGFPARLVVPGLYGYVSATKWLSQIELNDFSEVDGYWIPRGWSKEGPILTQSRIDVPRPSSRVAAGLVAVAGVAWAPTRGIERVEVQVDDGPWEDAELAARLDVDCWRQWVYRWQADPGVHRLSVRATDDREVQTPLVQPVAPSGATGRHTISVLVEG